MLNINEMKSIERFLNGAVHLDVKVMKNGFKEEKQAIIEYGDGGKKIAYFSGNGIEVKPYNNLSSVQEYVARGVDGESSYRGNCPGKIIEQFINYIEPKVKGEILLADPMQGSGTSLDVIKRIGLDRNKNYWGNDLRFGFNALKDDVPVPPNAIWIHPPYFVGKRKDGSISNMPRYSGVQWGEKADISLDDGSHIHSYEKYIKWLNELNYRMYEQLKKGGFLGCLLGASKVDGVYYDPIVDMSIYGKLESIVIKKQNNFKSRDIKYSNNGFISIEHEYLVIMKKVDNLIIPVKVTREIKVSMLSASNVTWKGLILNLVESMEIATIEQIYNLVKNHPKAKGNNFVREKVRQVLNSNKCIFNRVEEGTYSVA